MRSGEPDRDPHGRIHALHQSRAGCAEPPDDSTLVQRPHLHAALRWLDQDFKWIDLFRFTRRESRDRDHRAISIDQVGEIINPGRSPLCSEPSTGFRGTHRRQPLSRQPSSETGLHSRSISEYRPAISLHPSITWQRRSARSRAANHSSINRATKELRSPVERRASKRRTNSGGREYVRFANLMGIQTNLASVWHGHHAASSRAVAEAG